MLLLRMLHVVQAYVHHQEPQVVGGVSREETREDTRVKTQLQLSNELMRQKTTPEETRLETRGDQSEDQRGQERRPEEANQSGDPTSAINQTETWLEWEEFACLNESVLPSHSNVHIP